MALKSKTLGQTLSLWFGLFLLGLLLSLGFQPQLPVQARGELNLPLSTRGAQLIDASGRPVLLRGVNWFGIETDRHVPHGLWVRDYKEMLAQIKGSGYNFIRLPYSVQALRSSAIAGVDFSIGANRDFQNKTPQEAMDLIIQAAQRQGLMILLDSHRLNDREIPPLWYDSEYREQDWLNTWLQLAQRYRNQPNVIGADLKNEPHGIATWGSNDPKTDWRLAAERAGNAILRVNPHWLIVVEGVEKRVPGQLLETHWQGGNLEGVRKFPVRLNQPKQLVYSPHEYGPGVFLHAWFKDKKFPANLRDRWEKGFHFIASRNQAPILIGEFGGRQVDEQSQEGIWQRSLVEFIRSRKLSFAYWSWNPNSADTGGLLQDDWKTLVSPKQQLLGSLLPVPMISPREPAPIVCPEVRAPGPKPAASQSPASLLRSLQPQSSS